VPQLDRADRLTAILERDGPTCIWCGRSFGALIRPTTEHVVPRVKGGPAWAENEVPACRSCNRRRGHAAPSLFLEEAPDPRRDVIERSLLALRDAGADLSPDHGYPARIIVPALPGVHCTKWVGELHFT